MTGVVFAIPEFGSAVPGGIAAFYNHLISRLCSNGVDARVCLSHGRNIGQGTAGTSLIEIDSSHEERAKTRLARMRTFPSIFTSLVRAYAAFYAVREVRHAGVVETTDFALSFVPWLVEDHDNAVVVQLHGSTGQVTFHDALDADQLNGFIVRLFEAALLGRANALWTASELNGREWQALLHRTVEVRRPCMKMDDAPCLHQHEPTEGIDRAMVVGRLQGWKGPEDTCEALRLEGSLPVDWYGGDHLDPKSGGPMSAALASRYPTVWGTRLLWKGAVDQQTVARMRMDIPFAICPSRWDTFNLAAVEACIAGQVVVASRAAGVCEILSHGTSGLLVPSGSPDALATALGQLRALTPQERRSIGRAGHDAVARHLGHRDVLEARIAGYRDTEKSAPDRPRHPWIDALFAAESVRDVWDLTREIPLRTLMSSVVDRVAHKVTS